MLRLQEARAGGRGTSEAEWRGRCRAGAGRQGNTGDRVLGAAKCGGSTKSIALRFRDCLGVSCQHRTSC